MFLNLNALAAYRSLWALIFKEHWPFHVFYRDLQDHRTKARKASAGERSTLDLKPMRKSKTGANQWLRKMGLGPTKENNANVLCSLITFSLHKLWLQLWMDMDPQSEFLCQYASSPALYCNQCKCNYYLIFLAWQSISHQTIAIVSLKNKQKTTNMSQLSAHFQ